MSPPTVGRRLRNLEERLDLRLFARGRGDLQLTPVGRAILGVAEEMERKSFDLGRAITRQSFVHEPPVRITCIGSVALFLTRHFEELYAATGQTDVEILSTGQRLSLARNEADIALRMGKIPSRGNLFSRRIGRIAYAPYASLGFLRVHDIDTPDAALRSLFIGFKKNPRRRSQSSWLYDFGRQGRFPLRVNELHMRYEGARRGSGITLLPCHLGDPEPELVGSRRRRGNCWRTSISDPCDGARGSARAARGRRPDQALRRSCPGADGQPSPPVPAGVEFLSVPLRPGALTSRRARQRTFL